MFNERGFSPATTADAGEATDPADAGFGGQFAACDQHTHLVKEVLELDGHPFELVDWHHGGDTARVAVDPVHGGAGWVVMVDLDRMRAIECLVVAAPDAVKDIVKAAADAAVAKLTAQTHEKAATAPGAAAGAAAGAATGAEGSGHLGCSRYVSALTAELKTVLPDLPGLHLLEGLSCR